METCARKAAEWLENMWNYLVQCFEKTLELPALDACPSFKPFKFRQVRSSGIVVKALTCTASANARHSIDARGETSSSPFESTA